jgi:hypothetical protein
MFLTQTTIAIFASFMVTTIGIGSMILYSSHQPANAFTSTDVDFAKPKAPTAISGDNVYVTWWTNNTANGNGEVMFRASTDGGISFGDKINLSNTTDSDSTRAEIDSDGNNVIVTWWETNQTDDTPVAIVSNDAGATFGPMVMLGQNGTIGSSEQATEEEATDDE